MSTDTATIADPERGLKPVTRNRLIIYVGILALANYLTTLVPKEPSIVTHLDGSVATSAEVHRATLGTLFFSIQLFGFLLGAVVSLIPFRNWTYGQKYLGASLLCMVTIHGILLLGSIVGLTFR